MPLVASNSTLPVSLLEATATLLAAKISPESSGVAVDVRVAAFVLRVVPEMLCADDFCRFLGSKQHSLDSSSEAV